MTAAASSSTEQPASEAGTWVCAQVAAEETPVDDNEAWCFAIGAEDGGGNYAARPAADDGGIHAARPAAGDGGICAARSTLVLADSGSDEHICARSFAPQIPVHIEAPGGMRLTDVNNEPVRTTGAMHVPQVLGETDTKAVLGRFRFGENMQPGTAIYSLGKLSKEANMRFVLDAVDPHAVNLTTGERIDMKMMRNSFYFQAANHGSLKDAVAATKSTR